MADADKVLVVEISGKRPGDKKARATECFDIQYPHLIISNNSEGYETDWEIVNVPEDYVAWYKENCKSSDNSWYAPMNRSYAIKYAREHGYKYLVQLDDNIVMLQIAYSIKTYEDDDIIMNKTYRATRTSAKSDSMINDFIGMAVAMLECTNAGMAGFNMSGAAVPGGDFLCERYVYSFFALNLDVVPDHFQGDFEDDIDFRLKLSQMNIPSIQCAAMMYGKTGQAGNKDLTGCRKAYADAGVKRGEHMRKLYGDVYSAGLSSRNNRAGKQTSDGTKYFRHKLKPVKVGITVKDRDRLVTIMQNMLIKYSEDKADKTEYKNV